MSTSLARMPGTLAMALTAGSVALLVRLCGLGCARGADGGHLRRCGGTHR